MAFPKHGYWGTRTYHTWSSMMQRCRDENSTSYPLYGGRGIRVCARWYRFENFLADMGDRPAETSIDRIDPSGHYEPANCRWAPPRTQARNRRNNKIAEYKGVRASIAELADMAGQNARRVYRRLADGWPLARALETK